MLCLPVLCFSISLYRSRRNPRVEVSGSSKRLSVLVISRRAIHRHRHWRRSEVCIAGQIARCKRRSWRTARREVRIGWYGGVVVEERSYLAAEDRVQADSIRLHRVLAQKILTRIIRQSSPSPHSHPSRPPGDVDESRSTPKAYRGRGVWDVERQD